MKGELKMKSSKIRNVVFLVVTLLVPIFAGSEEKSVPNFDMMLRPTIEVYAEEVANCDVSDLDFSQGLVSVQNICQELMDSPICQDIDKQYRMDCSNIKLDPEERMDFSDKPGDTRIASEEYELDHGADTAMGEGVSIVWNCLKGGGQFVANLFGALLSLVQGAAILTISSFTETEAEKELFDNFKGLKNYLATEIEKEELKTEAEGRSSFPMVSALWNIIWDGIKTRYWKNFACLSAEGRNKLICEATTEIAAIAATGAFAGGTKVLGAAWNTLKAPRAAIKTVVDKNPLGKAAKSRRRAKKEAKPKVKQARKDVSKAETALKQARKKVSKSQRNRVLRPLMSKEKALVKASDKKDSALLAVKQAEKSLRDARVGVYRMAPGRAKRKAESRVRKAEANLKKAQEKLAMAERSERKAKGAIKTFRENRAKNKLAKKEAKKAEKDVNKAIKALSVQEKTKAKAVGQPSQKRLEQRALAKSEARQALAQAESSLESARKAVEKAVPGSRGERLALARLEKAESNLNLTKKKLRIKQTATPKGTSKPAVAKKGDAEAKPSTPAPKDTGPGTSAEQAAKRSASAKKAAETRKRNQQAKAQSTAPKTSAKKGDTETPPSTPATQAQQEDAARRAFISMKYEPKDLNVPQTQQAAKRSASAKKGVETRRRNQQAKAQPTPPKTPAKKGDTETQPSAPAQKAAETRRGNQQRQVETKVTREQSKLIEDLTGYQAASNAVRSHRVSVRRAKGTDQERKANIQLENATQRYNQAKAKKEAIEKAHQVGKGQLGKDGKPAGIKIDKDGKVTGNFTPAQIRKKREILKTAGFTKEQSKQLMDSGAVGLTQARIGQMRQSLRESGFKDAEIRHLMESSRSASARRAAETRRRNQQAQAEAQKTAITRQEKIIKDLTGVQEAEKVLISAREMAIRSQIDGPPLSSIANKQLRNASLRYKEAQVKRSAIEKAHQVGKGQLGKDGKPAGIKIDKDGKVTGNFTPAQIRKKRQILKEAGFTKEQSKLLMDSGAVGLRRQEYRVVATEKVRDFLRDAGFKDAEIRQLIKRSDGIIKRGSRFVVSEKMYGDMRQRVEQARTRLGARKKVVRNLRKQIGNIKYEQFMNTGSSFSPVMKGTVKKRYAKRLSQLNERLTRATANVNKAKESLNKTKANFKKITSNSKLTTGTKIGVGIATGFYGGRIGYAGYKYITDEEDDDEDEGSEE